jgi:hypothetical protein
MRKRLSRPLHRSHGLDFPQGHCEQNIRALLPRVPQALLQKIAKGMQR